MKPEWRTRTDDNNHALDVWKDPIVQVFADALGRQPVRLCNVHEGLLHAL